MANWQPGDRDQNNVVPQPRMEHVDAETARAKPWVVVRNHGRDARGREVLTFANRRYFKRVSAEARAARITADPWSPGTYTYVYWPHPIRLRDHGFGGGDHLPPLDCNSRSVYLARYAPRQVESPAGAR